MNAGRTVHLVVPDGIDDPLRPSGGNVYDRRLSQALATGGWSVRTRGVDGAWPCAGDAGREALGAALAGIPDGSLVLVDGLVASPIPEVLVPSCRRLRLTVLVHMPVGLGGRAAACSAGEREALRAAGAVVTTSDWSRSRLLAAYDLDPARVHVAHPGVDAAERAVGSRDGGNLLCVGVVTPGKGQDVLLAALARVVDLPWHCVCVGALTVDPDFVGRLRRGAQQTGLHDRFQLIGPRTGRALEAAFAAADVLVLPSRGETYGMVVTEALARGLPVVAADVGGVPEALGMVTDGKRPGLLTPAGDVTALAGSLRRWLSEPDLRVGLREAALERRSALPDWVETADRVARVLEEVAA